MRISLKNTVSYGLVISALAISGCGTTSDPTRFYSLQASSVEAQLAEQQNPLSIGLTSIRIPRLIDRPQIVSRKGNFEIKRSEFHQWAGSIQEDIERTIVSGLKKNLSTNKIYIYPNQIRPKPSLELTINILRLDGEIGSETTLNLHWHLRDRNSRQNTYSGNAHLSQPLTDTSYSSYVEGLNKVLDRATLELANEIKSIHMQK